MDFSSLKTVLHDYPDVKFIGHGPFFWKHISADAKPGGLTHPVGQIKEGGLAHQFLREHNNLYADISGYSGFNAMNRDRNFANKFLLELSHKILFGTDNEVGLGLERLLESLGIPSGTLKKICGENAIKLLS